MAKAQETLDQYNKVRSEITSKGSAYAEEAENKKQSILVAFSGIEEEGKTKEIAHRVKAKFAKKFRKDNKEILTEYKRLGQEHRNNEKQFNELFTKAKELFPDLKKKIFREMLMGKTEKKEAKEKMKTPELEKENHKIDFGLTFAEKKSLKLNETKNGVSKEKATAYINGREREITVLKKHIDGSEKNAFVREYMDDGVMPKYLVGEQLFNRYAVVNLGLEKRLPSYEQMKTIRGGEEKHQEFLKNNFQRHGQNRFPGCWNPNDSTFNYVGTRTDCWSSDGDHVRVDKGNMNHTHYPPEFGFSLRLLKN